MTEKVIKARIKLVGARTRFAAAPPPCEPARESGHPARGGPVGAPPAHAAPGEGGEHALIYDRTPPWGGEGAPPGPTLVAPLPLPPWDGWVGGSRLQSSRPTPPPGRQGWGGDCKFANLFFSDPREIGVSQHPRHGQTFPYSSIFFIQK